MADVREEHYLIRHDASGCFQIVCGEELSSLPDEHRFTILEQGDKPVLMNTQKQLQNYAYISGIDMMAPSTSPLCTISRVISVTSSGNTKFSHISNEPEPYEDSSDDFIPSSESEDTDSSTRDHVLQRFPSIRKVARILQFDSAFQVTVASDGPSCDSAKQVDDSCKSDVSHGSEVVSDDVPSTSTTTDCADITIWNKKQVTVNIYTSLHSGKFTLHSTRHFPEGGAEVLKAYVPKTKKDSSHKCCPVDPRNNIGYILYSPETDDITFVLHCCCQEGSAVGTMMLVEETEKWTGFLKYSCDKILDELDVMTPVKTKGTTVKETKMKQHYCMFCKKLKTCIGRHYKQQHSKEEKVQEILNVDTAQGHILMRKLRLESDQIYNKMVSLTDRIPVRKPQIQMTATSVHCPNCQGLIASKNLHKHHRKCTRRPPDRRRRLPMIRDAERLLSDPRENDDKLFEVVLKNMRNDEMKEIAQKDLVMKLLSISYMKSQSKTHNIHNVRQFLRRSVRLFLEVKKHDPDISEIKDLLAPTRYSLVMECVRRIGNFELQPEMRKASLAISFGPLFTKMINLYKIHLMKTGVPITDPQISALDTTLQVHIQEFKMDVSRTALVSMKEKRMSTIIELPTTKDIQLLVTYIKKVADTCYESLKNEEFSFQRWCDLGKALLCQLLVFNRRRVGEMSRIQLKDFKNRRDVSEDYFQSLNRLQIILAKEYSVFRIMAKRSRPVNVLVNRKQIEQLEHFVSLREKAGLTVDNTYLFGTSGQADGFLKANVALKQFAEDCGASKPNVLTGTYLRKHVATMSQMFSLSDNEIQQLADFLGHDRRVHELHYRLDEHNTQITKLTKFLCAVGDADVCSYKGKTIEELPFESEDTVDDELLEEEEEKEETDREDEIDHPGDENQVRPVASTSKKRTMKSTVGYISPKKLKISTRSNSTVKTPKKYVLRVNPKKSSKLKSPVMSQLLHTLSDPGKRQKSTKQRWNQHEVDIMHKEFAQFLNEKRLPPWNKCKQLKTDYPDIFSQRPVRSIYCWVRNYINK